MSYPLYCLYCNKVYYIHQSSATTSDSQAMFCSKECEDADKTELEAKNKIVDSQMKDHPGDFGKTLTSTSIGYSFAAASETKTTIDRVNEIFNNINKRKSDRD